MDPDAPRFFREKAFTLWVIPGLFVTPSDLCPSVVLIARFKLIRLVSGGNALLAFRSRPQLVREFRERGRGGFVSGAAGQTFAKRPLSRNTRTRGPKTTVPRVRSPRFNGPRGYFDSRVAEGGLLSPALCPGSPQIAQQGLTLADEGGAALQGGLESSLRGA